MAGSFVSISSGSVSMVLVACIAGNHDGLIMVRKPVGPLNRHELSFSQRKAYVSNYEDRLVQTCRFLHIVEGWSNMSVPVERVQASKGQSAVHNSSGCTVFRHQPLLPLHMSRRRSACLRSQGRIRDSLGHAASDSALNSSGSEASEDDAAASCTASNKESLDDGGWGTEQAAPTPAPVRAEPEGKPSELDALLKIRGFERTLSCAAGSLTVRPLAARYLDEAVNLLTDSFADLFGITFRPLLRLQVRLYLQQRLLTLPHGVTLLGLLQPPGAEQAPRVVATVELSFSQRGRPVFPTLNPPHAAPYLCNMAVLHAYRRQRVGGTLLEAAEALAAELGHPSLYLHCRLCDEAPQRLYRQAGYRVVDTDNLMAMLLLLQRRRYLMCKSLEHASKQAEPSQESEHSYLQS